MNENVPPLTLAEASAMVAAAQAHAATLAVPYSIAVVDGGGHLLHFVRADGGVAGCVELAINKAHTAVMFGQPTDALGVLAQPAAPLFGIQHALAGRAVVFGGGIPIRVDGRLVGAIGASAGTVEQDVAVARSGVRALLDTSVASQRRSPSS